MSDMAGRNGNGGLLRIGTLAERSGMTARSIRYYEELGLVSPAARSNGRFRLYEPSSLVRLEYIRRLAEAGLSLADIIALFNVWESSASGDERRELVLAIAADYKEEIEKRRKVLDLVERELSLILDTVADCLGCARHPAYDTCGGCDVVLSRTELPELVSLFMPAVCDVRTKERE